MRNLPDYDPEEAYATYADGRSLDQADNSAHQDYVDVGCALSCPFLASYRWVAHTQADRGRRCETNRTSKLRKKGEAVLDAKYDGKKGSRAAIFGGESDDGDEQEEEEDLPSGDDDDDDDNDDEMGSFEDLEGGDDEDDDSEQDDQDQDVDSEDEDAEEAEEEEAPRPKKSKAASTNRAKVQDERVMVSQLKQAASADVEKGRAVKKQLVRYGLLRRHERMHPFDLVLILPSTTLALPLLPSLFLPAST